LGNSLSGIAHPGGQVPPGDCTSFSEPTGIAADEWHIYGTPDSKLNQFVELWPKLTEQVKQELLTLAKSYLD
ncbi:hypothetical protein N9Z58_02095, partial [bacterium]|nr:hypothetical protein [bacterium]